MTEKISVITTVYNCEKYISRSIESILQQTYENFELIIVEDGSIDNTLNIIKTFALQDKRIIVIENNVNRGRIYSLNTALRASTGEYIAIQDADDVSMPDRLRTEYDFLIKNPEVVLVGADISIIDQNENKVTEIERPEEDLEAKFSLLFRCTFANPSVLYRKKIITSNNIEYEDEFPYAEDFRIISRISRFGKVKNLKEKLIKYRWHESNSTFFES